MSKLKAAAARLVNLTPFTKELAVRLCTGLASWKYKRISRQNPVEEKTIVFEAFLGKQYACSPKALFLEMAENPEYSEYEKIWLFCQPEKYKSLEKYPNTKVVKYGSPEFYRSYARARYWVTNYHLPRGISKAPGQVYIQTWHGTPLKKIGCDVSGTEVLKADRRRAYREYAREGQIIDYMPSPSPFYTEKIKSAFLLGAQAEVLECGYPRNDALFTADEEKCREIRERLGLPADRKVILYAPTWRDDQHSAGTGYTYEPGIDFDRLRAELGAEYVVLFRAHYLIGSSFDFEKYGGFIRNVSRYDDVNDLYLVSDLLVTDYSSVFFDYANLRRPILFYMYDYEEYKSRLRDFYFGIEELPGPVIREKRDISGDIRSLTESFSCDGKYEAFNRKFNPFPRASSAAVLERILGKSTGKQRDRKALQEEKCEAEGNTEAGKKPV